MLTRDLFPVAKLLVEFLMLTWQTNAVCCVVEMSSRFFSYNLKQLEPILMIFGTQNPEKTLLLNSCINSSSASCAASVVTGKSKIGEAVEQQLTAYVKRKPMGAWTLVGFQGKSPFVRRSGASPLKLKAI